MRTTILLTVDAAAGLSPQLQRTNANITIVA